MPPTGYTASGWFDTVGGDKLRRARDCRRQARRGNCFTLGLLAGQLKIQPQQEGVRVFGGAHAVSGADGGGEGGVGVAEPVGAGGFEGVIEFAQGPAVGGRDLAVGAPNVSTVRTLTCSVPGDAKFLLP
jgi:hypothetical protein